MKCSFHSPTGRRSSELFALLGSPFIRAIRGRIGNLVFRTYRGKIIVSRAPNFDGYVPTAAQRKQRQRMREAASYARCIYADPAAKAFYLAVAQKLNRQPFRLAVADYLRGHDRVGVMAGLNHRDTKSTEGRAAPERPEIGCQAWGVKNSKLKTLNSELRRSCASRQPFQLAVKDYLTGRVAAGRKSGARSA
jgi:hypothetical protein